MTKATRKKPLPASSSKKSGLHPRNKHNQRYDFPALISTCPDLEGFVATNQYGDLSVNFSDSEAVKALNKALLQHFYQVEHWTIPDGYLCPPIPGRADYVHHIADLLAASNNGELPKGKAVRALDIGMGANCVYPIVGHREYGWHFTGSDVDPISVKTANFIVSANPSLKKGITCHLQKNPDNIFVGMFGEDDAFDFTMCNPPFHKSLAEASAGTERKLRNLAANKRGKGTASADSSKEKALNFGGQKAELWCPGGEFAFVRKMAQQSTQFAEQCLWFTTLLSKKDNLKGLYKELEKLGVKEVKTVEMAQGQKISRFVAWTFLTKDQQQQWAEERW